MELGRLKIGIEQGAGFTWFYHQSATACGCSFVTILGMYFCWAGSDCRCGACGNWNCTCEAFFNSIEGEDFAEYPLEE
jgi:hypothetical protein